MLFLYLLLNNDPDAKYGKKAIWQACLLLFRSIGIAFKAISLLIAMILCLPLVLVMPMIGVYFVGRLQDCVYQARNIDREATNLDHKTEAWAKGEEDE